MLMGGSITASARNFTNKSGQTIEAEIVAKQGDQLRIRRTDGTEFTISLQTLSADDQDYVAMWQPPAGKAAAKPGAAAAPVDERVKPGATVALEFPNLPTDQNGMPATCNVRIPENYDPAKPLPLLVWIGGGKGGNNPGGGLPLVDKTVFAVAALPYPSTNPVPADAMEQGKMAGIFNYQKPMLEELKKLLPNLDPKVRIVAGFSNGAHTIGNAIQMARPEYTEFFHAFVIIEGGAITAVPKKKEREKFAYLAWGNDVAKKGSEEFMKTMLACAKEAKLVMNGVGHAFPDTEKAKVKDWIEKTVIPGLAKTKS